MGWPHTWLQHSCTELLPKGHPWLIFNEDFLKCGVQGVSAPGPRVPMLEHQGSPSVSIPCSSFHHRSAMRAAEATTMVLLWAKILIVQLDPTNDRIIPLPHPQRSWELPRLLWSQASCNGGVSAADSVLPHWSHVRSCPNGRGTGSRLPSLTVTAPISRHSSTPMPGTQH